MSQENVRIMREMFALVNDRGVKAATDALGDLLDPEFELEEASNVPDRESYTGRDAFIANMAKLDESFEGLRIEPIEFVDLGDQLVAVIRSLGEGASAGLPWKRQSLSFGPCVTAKRSRCGTMRRSRKPSKPPNFRSRRCRRRTSS
jgi:ketosteroid isomerase-like protein